jgi:hypothetical protein
LSKAVSIARDSGQGMFAVEFRPIVRLGFFHESIPPSERVTAAALIGSE